MAGGEQQISKNVVVCVALIALLALVLHVLILRQSTEITHAGLHQLSPKIITKKLEMETALIKLNPGPVF